MDIGNALRKTGREEITIRSVIANNIQLLYEEKTGRKIIIQSVKIHGKKIIISTGNALLSSELQIMQGNINERVVKKLSQLGIKIHPENTFYFK